jgi:ribonuclease HII
VQLPTLEIEDTQLVDHDMVIGIDEVGRGCVAGPVVCGAVALVRPVTQVPDGLADSKLITERRRQALVEPVKQWSTAWALGWADAQTVDQFGIMGALHIASRQALAAIPVTSSQTVRVILDGNRDYLSEPPANKRMVAKPLPDQVSVMTVIKGDQRCACVAGASVLAKVARDACMVDLAQTYPDYGFANHVGYLTAAHKAALVTYGPTPLHRTTFAGVL